jgi:hypothetical protein
VTSIDQVANAIVAGKPLYLGCRPEPVPARLLQNMALWMLNNYVAHRKVWYAVPMDDTQGE